MIRLRYKLKDTSYSYRKDFPKKAVEIYKKLKDQMKKLPEDGEYTVFKYYKIVTRDTRSGR